MFGYSWREIWFQIGTGVVTTGFTSGIAWVFDASVPQLIIWALLAFCLGLIISNQLLIRKNLKGDGSFEAKPEAKTPASKISPLKIEFAGADVRKITETNPMFPSDQVTRRFYGVRVRNDGPENINHVSLEVEKIEQIPDRADEIVPVPAHLGLKFLFKLNNKPMQNFSPQLSDRVPLISHVNTSFLSNVFKMASTQRYEFPHNNRRHRIHVKVTGSGTPHVSRTFLVWVDGEGNMKMTGE